MDMAEANITPPINPPPGLLCPANKRYIENNMAMGTHTFVTVFAISVVIISQLHSL